MESIKKRKLLVNNMTCEGCEEKIKNEVLKLNGVNTVEVNHKTGTVNVRYDLLQVNLSEIENKIKSTGYKLNNNLLYKLKSGFIHFLEENERDNITTKVSSCCSNPVDIIEKAEKNLTKK